MRICAGSMTLHTNNGPTPGTVPAYFELNTRLAWQASKRLELSVVGQNLLHDHHPEYGFPGPDERRDRAQRLRQGRVAILICCGGAGSPRHRAAQSRSSPRGGTSRAEEFRQVDRTSAYSRPCAPNGI